MPDSWTYRFTMSGPSGTYVRRVTADQVLHPRINVDASEPYRGRSPVALAGLSAGTLAGLERQFKREASANSGCVVPSAIEGMADAAFQSLKNDIANAAGTRHA